MRLPIDTRRRQWVAVSASQQKTDQKGDARTAQRTKITPVKPQAVPAPASSSAA
jgi:hypothetical protein